MMKQCKLISDEIAYSSRDWFSSISWPIYNVSTLYPPSRYYSVYECYSVGQSHSCSLWYSLPSILYTMPWSLHKSLHKYLCITKYEYCIALIVSIIVSNPIYILSLFYLPPTWCGRRYRSSFLFDCSKTNFIASQDGLALWNIAWSLVLLGDWQILGDPNGKGCCMKPNW